jgi:hypothetical protein
MYMAIAYLVVNSRCPRAQTSDNSSYYQSHDDKNNAEYYQIENNGIESYFTAGVLV